MTPAAKSRVQTALAKFGVVVVAMSAVAIVLSALAAYRVIESPGRRLFSEDDPDCNSDPESSNPNSSVPEGFPPAGKKLCDGEEWKLIFAVVVVMYMFWALAIVVDEFFVPALDVLSDSCGFSPDVAGATLMAAGGSAPEFFTSLFSAVQEPPSATGFGTIVGSAVFNVLFVIALCAIFSKETLSLTWWPLLRDCTYYSISLIVLAIFFVVGGGNGVITTAEAVVLFLLYCGYVFLMSQNENLQEIISKRLKLSQAESNNKTLELSTDLAAAEQGQCPTGATSFAPDAGQKNKLLVRGSSENVLFLKPSKFRSGVLHISMTGNAVTAAGIAAVSKVMGDVHETAARFDKDEDGSIDRSELKHLFDELTEGETKEEEVDAAMKEIDVDEDGVISIDEFSAWYAKSTALLVSQIHSTFKRIDRDNDGTISFKEIITVLTELNDGEALTEADLESVKSEFPDESCCMKRSDFEKWYIESMFWTKARRKQAEKVEAMEPFSLFPPPPTFKGRLVWALSLPLTVTLFFTVPSTRRPSMHNLPWALVSFGMSILWIAFYSWLMVLSAEIFSKTLGIPVQITGITILAAGTSVPDLLSSVIVARQGYGDMAVSSSIGSNIFDILVGLPVPWLISIAAKGKFVEVGSDGLAISVVILLFMLISVVTIIKCSDWKLTRSLAISMLALYVIYVVQELARADW